MTYQDATGTIACIVLLFSVPRDFTIAFNLETGVVHGIFNGVWWAA